MREIFERLAYESNHERMVVIANQLQKIGIEYAIHKIDSDIGNIVIDLRKNQTDKYYLFCAHYDIVGDSSGANDNASGVIQLLNLLEKEAFKSICAIIVFTAYEEENCRGSQELLKQIEASQIIGVINIDSCGWGNKVFYCNRIKNNIFNVLDNMNGLIRLDNMPFSEEVIYEDYAIPAITISTMSDVEEVFFRNVERKSRLEEVDRAEYMRLPVFSTMHCGANDNINIINYKLMKNVEEILIGIINRLEKLEVKNEVSIQSNCKRII